jgi:membrane fusion protein (multidrug efflux system)
MTAATVTSASVTSARAAEKTAETPADLAPPKRRRTPVLLASLTGVALLVTGSWYATHLGRESTDDAQVEGHVMSVSARVAGQVLHVRITDNQVVNAGDVLLELDPADYAARADGARADLAAARAAADAARATLALTKKTAPATIAQARGGVTAAASSVVSARAATEQARASVVAAESRRALAELEWKRANSLVAQSAIPGAELDTRRTELDAANATLEEERARLASADASLEGSGGGMELARGRLTAAETAEEQIASARAASELADARVAQAESALKLAELNLSYTRVRAARRGVISRRSVEEGQMVGPERPLFAIVPLDDVWIVANFKEDQLSRMAVGSKADVEIDTYASRRLRAHVESVAGGTGARFALLPPDNATGNFVKVVQRLPVLLRIDDAAGLELRPGMSADVTVDTRSR